jgi:hypothetical protein
VDHNIWFEKRDEEENDVSRLLQVSPSALRLLSLSSAVEKHESSSTPILTSLVESKGLHNRKAGNRREKVANEPLDHTLPTVEWFVSHATARSEKDARKKARVLFWYFWGQESFLMAFALGLVMTAINAPGGMVLDALFDLRGRWWIFPAMSFFFTMLWAFVVLLCLWAPRTWESLRRRTKTVQALLLKVPFGGRHLASLVQGATKIPWETDTQTFWLDRCCMPIESINSQESRQLYDSSYPKKWRDEIPRFQMACRYMIVLLSEEYMLSLRCIWYVCEQETCILRSLQAFNLRMDTSLISCLGN